MGDVDPARAASLDDLASCLRQLHLRADSPSYRLLEERTKHANGLLPGTKIGRVPLRRSTLSEVLQGQTLPRKGFLLTFVEVCGVDLNADRRWEQAWDRLADQAQHQDGEMATGQLYLELAELRRQLAEAQHRAEVAQAQADKAATELRAIVQAEGDEPPVYTLRDLIDVFPTTLT